MSPSPSRRVSSSTDGIEPGAMKTEQHQVHHTHLGHSNNLGQMHSGAMTISPELFEKLYLQPKIPQYAHFANPTPMGLVGFVISTFTFSMILMGWGGASGFPAVVGIFFFVGPLMLTLAAIFNWIMGNFYPMMATSLFAVFWLSFGMLQLPTLGLAAYYSSDGTNATEGATSADYNTILGLYCIVWGFAFLTYLIFALKTNAVFAGIFLLAAAAVWVLSGAYFATATGNYTTAGNCQITAGALLFVVSILGWWIVVAMMAAEMRIGINIPIGDLSHFWADTKAAQAAEDIEKQD